MSHTKIIHTCFAPTDSAVVADTVWVSVCREIDAPSAQAEQLSTHVGMVPYRKGIEGEQRSQLPGYDTGVVCLLLVLFLFIASNFRHYSTFIKNFSQNLWSTRTRQNAFDNHTTNEIRVYMSLISLLCFSEGVLLFSAMDVYGGVTQVFPVICLTTVLCGVYYALQVGAYNVVGYVFLDAEEVPQWVKGFKSSQVFLGLTLVVPMLLALYNPRLVPVLLALGVILYVAARIIFIFKGFRIFYTNKFSLIYIILYLCSLEIVPLFVMYRVVKNACHLFD